MASKWPVFLESLEKLSNCASASELDGTGMTSPAVIKVQPYGINDQSCRHTVPGFFLFCFHIHLSCLVKRRCTVYSPTDITP